MKAKGKAMNDIADKAQMPEIPCCVCINKSVIIYLSSDFI
jgi:hypothetical protein